MRLESISNLDPKPETTCTRSTEEYRPTRGDSKIHQMTEGEKWMALMNRCAPGILKQVENYNLLENKAHLAVGVLLGFLIGRLGLDCG